MKKLAFALLMFALVGAGCQKAAPTYPTSFSPDEGDGSRIAASSTTTVYDGEASGEYKEYKNDNYTINFRYPAEWTVSEKEQNFTLSAEFFDTSNQPVMNFTHPIPDTGYEGVVLHKEEEITLRDGTVAKLTFLRPCDEFKDEGECAVFGRGLGGIAFWNNTLFNFNSFEENNSTEEERMIGVFREVVRSLGK